MKYIHFKPKKGKGPTGVMTLDVRESIEKLRERFPDKIFTELWKLKD